MLDMTAEERVHVLRCCCVSALVWARCVRRGGLVVFGVADRARSTGLLLSALMSLFVMTDFISSVQSGLR